MDGSQHYPEDGIARDQAKSGIFMNIDALMSRLSELNIPEDAYSFAGGFPNESYCIVETNNKWEVYYSERGSKTSLRVFEDEDLACEHFLNMMRRCGYANSKY